ncbi:hypothetical protein, partial [Frankia sp. AgB1.8]|uniref:hypothetical protein n=1 Tax=Frankia sp. AgB1.8 TaxID=2792839 RepID=UPI001EE45BED
MPKSFMPAAYPAITRVNTGVAFWSGQYFELVSGTTSEPSGGGGGGRGAARAPPPPGGPPPPPPPP